MMFLNCEWPAIVANPNKLHIKRGFIPHLVAKAAALQSSLRNQYGENQARERTPQQA
jgi:hypothetical protein